MKNKRISLALVTLLALLIICSLCFASGGFTRLAWSLFGYVGLFTVFWFGKLSLSDIGLSRKNLVKGLKYGGLSVLGLGIFFAVVFTVNKSFFQDSRYNQELSVALVSTLLILPLKTVLFEELTFRGVLPALIRKLGRGEKTMAFVSSIAFGLWHIPTAPTSETYSFGVLLVPSWMVVLFVVVFTSMAGLFFYELRRRSGSLVAPIIVHWFVNGSAIILASLSWS